MVKRIKYMYVDCEHITPMMSSHIDYIQNWCYHGI